MRAVIDTNILVRAMLKPRGSVAAVLAALREQRFLALYSEATLNEAVEVLGRSRMRLKYGITDRDVRGLVRLLVDRGEKVSPDRPVQACRDPKDDKFLETALAGKADVIVTGDEDLFVLHPFEGIPIVRPVDFLKML